MNISSNDASVITQYIEIVTAIEEQESVDTPQELKNKD